MLTFKTIDGFSYDVQLIRAKGVLKLLPNPKSEVPGLEMPTPNTPNAIIIKDIGGNTVYENNLSIIL